MHLRMMVRLRCMRAVMSETHQHLRLYQLCVVAPGPRV